MLNIAAMEKGCSLSKIFSKPPPAKVNINDPGAIPTTVVQTNVLKETPKKAGARLTRGEQSAKTRGN